MRSMTGYGEASGENARHVVSVSLKAVNHRFLDLQLRLGEDVRSAEPALRELLGKDLERGRVEVRVDVRPLGERKVDVHVHMGVVEAAYAATHRLVEAGLVDRGLGAGDLLRLPEAFRVEVAREEWDEQDEELLLRVAREGLAQLVASREREGRSLAAIFTEKLDALGEVVGRLDALRGPVREEMVAAFHKRLGEMLEGRQLDESRIAQEAALLVDRSDVSEEIDRLRAHLDHFRSVAGGEEASGKRLDFLTQEIFRELNTLGAKCRNAEMTRAVLDAKVLCEQIREQVQNVE
ncbi:MAG TPA: YicC/YloC family endoribonuclease [Thermoanaerobaculia bacterium]|nr:YicC/YloC family endoribonuclease [Thermoanaerobaculia bacterium]